MLGEFYNLNLKKKMDENIQIMFSILKKLTFEKRFHWVCNLQSNIKAYW